MKAFCFFLLVQCLTSSPSTTTMAQKLRGGGAADLLITEEDHRTLTSTCPSRVSASYQQGNNVIPCTQNSDCSGWSQDAPGCCLYPYCICGADIPGATSVVCLADSGTTRPEPPSSPLPLVYIGPTPRPAARPSALHLNPTAKPTARSTPKKHTSGSTVQPTSKPKPKMPTFKPTTKRTPSPLRKSTPAPALQVNRNELPSFATIDFTPTPPQNRPAPAPTVVKTTKTCPSSVSSIYQGITGDSTIIPCKQNSDCAGWTQDGSGCCLYPYCICGANIPGASSVTCLRN
jgi:hypothetical protein